VIIDALEVDAGASDVKRAQGRPHLPCRILPLHQTGYPRALLKGAPAKAKQHGRRPDLHEGIRTLCLKVAERFHEAHRPTDLLDPVAGRRDIGRHDAAGADHRDTGRLEPGSVDAGAECFKHRLHQTGVEGMTDSHARTSDAMSAEHPQSLLDFFDFAGKHHLRGAVDGGDVDTLRLIAKQADDRFGFATDGGHGAGSRDGRHEIGPLGYQRQAGFQIQHAGDMGRGVLANTVAADPFGRDTPMCPLGGQRQFQRHQRRLGKTGIGQKLAVTLDHQITDRHAQAGCEDRIATIEEFAEHGLAAVQLAAHADILRALPGIEKGEAGALTGSPDAGHAVIG
jgi:hypothetical protein